MNKHGSANPRFVREAGNQPQSIYFWVRMYQLVMLNKLVEIPPRLEKAKIRAQKQRRQAVIEGRDFFSLLLARDKAGLEKLILSEAQNDKADNPWVGGLIAPVPTIEAKLCWLNGVDVEIDHPLIPMELMPIKPLPRYDDLYDFLDPNWTPPQPTFMQRIKHLFVK